MQVRLVFLASLLALQGCATVRPVSMTVEVSVESRALATSAASRTFVLVPGNRGVKANDTEFRNYASYLRQILSNRGLVPAGKASDADVWIVLSYGVVDPHAPQDGQPTPAWLQTRAGSGITAGTVTSGGTAPSRSTGSTEASSYGMVGASQGSADNVMYFRYAKMDAYKAGPPQVEPIWTTKAVSIGSSHDLQKIFPFLVTAAAPYLAATTDHVRFATVRESDLIVK